MNFQSVMDRPERVSRVTPPNTTMLNTHALHPPIHHANGILPGPSPAADAANPRVAVARMVDPTALAAGLAVLHRPPFPFCVSQVFLASPRSCRSAVKAAVRRARSAATAIASTVLPRLLGPGVHRLFEVNFPSSLFVNGDRPSSYRVRVRGRGAWERERWILLKG